MAEPADPESTTRAELLVEPVGESRAARDRAPSTLRREVSVPGRQELTLDAGTTYRIRIEADGFWSAPAYVASEEGARAVRPLSLFPTGEVITRVAGLPRGGADVLSARFRSPALELRETLAGTTDCRIEDSLARCELPAGRFDLRLVAEGFVPQYLWGVELEPGGRLDLGRLTFERGSSVAGWVVARAPAKPAQATAHLLPLFSGAIPRTADRRRLEELERSAEVDERGFFQVAGVEPGSYRLEIRHPTHTALPLGPLQVLPERGLEIGEPIELQPPVDLTLWIHPPLDPQRRPWIVSLRGEDRIPGEAAEPKVARASTEGEAVIDGLAAGSYQLRLEDAGGRIWHLRDVDVLRPGSGETVELPMVEVEGEVTLGEHPVQAQLWFGGRRGAPRVELATDDEGRFAGVLPRPGIWRVDIEAQEPRISRTLRALEVEEPEGGRPARLRLELPDTELSGQVVQPDYSPAPGAMVLVTALDDGSLSRQVADAEGRFRFRGLEFGRYQVNALWSERGRKLSAEPVNPRLTESTPDREYRVILSDAEPFEGRVIGAAGPVMGAKVALFPRGTGGSFRGGIGNTVSTDVQGKFTTRVPRGTAVLDVTILPPGGALATYRVQAPFDGERLFEVEHLGGTLELAGVRFDPLDATVAQPVLFLDGVMVDAFLLEEWARLHGGSLAGEGTLSIPDLAPGQVVACRVPMHRQARLAIGPADPSSLRCAEGFLSPGAKLTLRLAEPGGS